MFGIKMTLDFFFLKGLFLNRYGKLKIKKGFLKSVHHFWVGKHCASYGHGFAEIPHEIWTPLLAYSYGRWIEWEYQLIAK